MTLTIDDLIQNLIANNNGKKDELITAIEKSANYGYKVAVDKACEWLLEWETHQGEDIEVVKQFKQAMKGE